MKPMPGASIPMTSLPNLRDLGGWSSADGRQVRKGVLFRSTDLSRLNDSDRAALAALEIGTVYDFRSAAEREAAPDFRLDGVRQVILDVLADAPHAIPGNLTKIFADPADLAAAESQLGGAHGATELMEATYVQLITLPSARQAYKRFFRELREDHSTPALFHCSTGKDRTGWAAAAFLSLMGVPRSDIYDEYLLTNEQLIPALDPIVMAFTRAGGRPDTLRPILGVERSYLDRAFSTLEHNFGTVEGYFSEGLGIDAAEQQMLRSLYLAPGYA